MKAITEQDIKLIGCNWVGNNVKQQGKGVGILVKKEIQFKVLNNRESFFDEGRCIGIEIGQHWIYLVYLPVSTDELD